MNIKKLVKRAGVALVLALFSSSLVLSSCSKSDDNDDTTMLVLLWILINQPAYPKLSSQTSKTNGTTGTTKTYVYSTDNTTRTVTSTNSSSSGSTYIETDTLDSAGNITQAVKDYSSSTTSDSVVTYSDFVDVIGDPVATTEKHYSGTTTADDSKLSYTVTRTFNTTANRVETVTNDYKTTTATDTKTAYTYDIAGNITGTVNSSRSGDSGTWTQTSAMAYTYDSSNRLSTFRWNNGASASSTGSSGYLWSHTYGTDGTTDTVKLYTGSFDVAETDANLLATMVTTYANGKVSSSVTSNKNGDTLVSTTYTYSTDGKTVTIVSDWTDTGLSSGLTGSYSLLGAVGSADTTVVRVLDDSSTIKTITQSTYSGLTASGTAASENQYTYVETSATNYNGWSVVKEAVQKDGGSVAAGLQSYDNSFFVSAAPTK